MHRLFMLFPIEMSKEEVLNKAIEEVEKEDIFDAVIVGESSGLLSQYDDNMDDYYKYGKFFIDNDFTIIYERVGYKPYNCLPDDIRILSKNIYDEMPKYRYCDVNPYEDSESYVFYNDWHKKLSEEDINKYWVIIIELRW